MTDSVVPAIATEQHGVNSQGPTALQQLRELQLTIRSEKEKNKVELSQTGFMLQMLLGPAGTMGSYIYTSIYDTVLWRLRCLCCCSLKGSATCVKHYI